MNFMPRLIPLLCLGAMTAWGAPAESTGVVFFDLRAAATADDFQTGGRVGVGTSSRVGWDFFFDLEMRPYRRAVRVRESETLEYQFREERLTLGPGVLARIPLVYGPSEKPSVVYTVGGGVGLSPAWYRGSNREAPSSGLGWLESGFRFSSASGFDWGVAYQYFPLPGVSNHRVAFGLGFRLGGSE